MRRAGRVALLFVALMLVFACREEIQPSASSPPMFTRSQMESSVSSSLNQRDPVVRMKTLVTALESLDRENVEGAAEAFSSNRAKVKIYDVTPFMHRWASFDPEAAMAFSPEGLKEGIPQTYAYQAIVSSWVESGDAEGAHAFMLKLQDEGDTVAEAFRMNLIDALIRNREFDLAMPMLEEMPETQGRNVLLLKLTFDLAEEGVPYLMDWSDSISVDAPNNLKAAVFANSLMVLVKSDPARASAWYAEQSHLDYVSPETLPQLVVEWIKYDPVAALEWTILQPPSDARDAAVRGAIYRWQKSDPEASEPWIRENISNPAMEVALYPFAQWLVYENPVEALAWGMRVPSKLEREYVVQQSFIRWRREDKEAAMAWLETSDLSESLKQDINGLIVLEGERQRAEGSDAAGEGAIEEADSSGQP